MHLTYDVKADAAYLYIVDAIEPGEVADSIELDAGETDPSNDLIIDVDDRGKLLGIEILGARAKLRPEVLEGARRGGGRGGVCE